MRPSGFFVRAIMLAEWVRQSSLGGPDRGACPEVRFAPAPPQATAAERPCARAFGKIRRKFSA